MPVTVLSHQALVLPLKMRWPRRFSGLALCIGSMAPDLEFIATLRDDWIVSHTLSAQFWFTVPVTMIAVWIVCALVLPVILPFVRDHPTWRLHDLAAIEIPRGWRGWTSVALSAWVGGVSHVVLDGFTHGNHSGWLVPWFPVLRTPVPHLGGSAPLHDALQLWLTVLLGLASVAMWRWIARGRWLWRWRQRDVQSLPRMPRAAGAQLITICLLAAGYGALMGHAVRAGESDKLVAAGIAFGALDFAVGAWCSQPSRSVVASGRKRLEHHHGSERRITTDHSPLQGYQRIRN